MKTKDQILDVLQGLRPELEARYNVKTIGLFGSALRGGNKDPRAILTFWSSSAALSDYSSFWNWRSCWPNGSAERWTWCPRRR